MKVAFNEFGFKHLPDAKPFMEKGLPGLISAAAEYGFTACQWCPHGEMDMAIIDGVNVAAAATEAADHGVALSFHNHAFFPLPTAQHYLDRDDWYDLLPTFLMRAIDIVKACGGDLVTFHPPQFKREDDIANGLAPRDVRMQMLDAYAELVIKVGEYANEKGAMLGIEAICFPEMYPGGCAFKAVDELEAFLDRKGMPDSVGVQIDTTHYHHKNQSIADVIRRFGSRVLDIHTSDAIVHQWTDADHYIDVMFKEVHLKVGDGTIDFAEMIEALNDIEFDRWLTLELYPQHSKSVKDLTDSRDALETLMHTADNN